MSRAHRVPSVPYINPIGPWAQLRANLVTSAFARAIRLNQFHQALHDTAVDLLNWMLREYNGRSRADWDKISPWTYALSRNRVKSPLILNIGQRRLPSHRLRAHNGTGTRRDATTFAELNRRARAAKPLIDTGRARAQFIRGKPFNIFEIGNDRLRVGSSDPVLVKHQRTHAAVFRFGPDEQRRLKKNIPPRTASGKWNSLYFILRNAMRKADGSTRKIPGRPMPDQPPPQIVNALRMRVARTMAPIIQSLFATRPDMRGGTA